MSRIRLLHNVTITRQTLLQTGILMTLPGEWHVLSFLTNTEKMNPAFKQ